MKKQPAITNNWSLFATNMLCLVKNLPVVAAFAVLMGCQETGSTESGVSSVAGSFSEAYFNYDLKEALRYSHPDFEKNILFLASNLSEEDLKAINASENGAEPTVSDVELLTDSTAIATIVVDNYVGKESIGSHARVYNNIVYELSLLKHNGGWCVRRAVPRQSGRRSRA